MWQCSRQRILDLFQLLAVSRCGLVNVTMRVWGAWYVIRGEKIKVPTTDYEYEYHSPFHNIIFTTNSMVTPPITNKLLQATNTL